MVKKKGFPFEITPQNDDEKWMIEALKLAWCAFENDEVPIGAVLVHQNRVIAKGYNQVELLKDATAHAEMLCITAASEELDNWRLAETTLYSTAEPCCMCAGAIFLSRVPRVVWGAPDLRHGAGGSFVDLFSMKHPTHQVEILPNILQEPCSHLLKQFFKTKRERKNGKGLGTDGATAQSTH